MKINRMNAGFWFKSVFKEEWSKFLKDLKKKDSKTSSGMPRIKPTMTLGGFLGRRGVVRRSKRF